MLNIITHQGEANQNHNEEGKTTRRYHFIATRWLKSKQELVLVRTSSSSRHRAWMQNRAAAPEKGRQFLNTFNTVTTQPNSSTLREVKTYVHTRPEQVRSQQHYS